MNKTYSELLSIIGFSTVHQKLTIIKIILAGCRGSDHFHHIIGIETFVSSAVDRSCWRPEKIERDHRICASTVSGSDDI